MRPVVAALIAVLATGAASAGQAPPTFRAGVDAVTVDVLATHRGRPISGLTASDFEVLDDGVRQQISFVNAGAVPIDLVLDLDTSESVAGDRLASLVAACRAAIQALRPIDRASIVTFSHEITEQTPLTGDRDRLVGGLGRLSAGGSTSLYDAAYAGLLLGKTGDARTLLLMFSDGRDTASWLAPSTVLDAAKRSNVIAYAVTTEAAPLSRAEQELQDPAPYLMRPSPGRGRYIFGGGGETAAMPRVSRGFLGRLVTATGGRLLGSSNPELAKRFVDIVQEFQNRYVLVYTPTGVDRPGWHDVTVKVTKRGVDVRARRGYWR